MAPIARHRVARSAVTGLAIEQPVIEKGAPLSLGPMSGGKPLDPTLPPESCQRCLLYESGGGANHYIRARVHERSSLTTMQAETRGDHLVNADQKTRDPPSAQVNPVRGRSQNDCGNCVAPAAVCFLACLVVVNTLNTSQQQLMMLACDSRSQAGAPTMRPQGAPDLPTKPRTKQPCAPPRLETKAHSHRAAWHHRSIHTTKKAY